MIRAARHKEESGGEKEGVTAGMAGRDAISSRRYICG